MSWTVTRGSEISAQKLYELLQVRTDIFVVEQECPYSELDGRDLGEDIFHVVYEIDNECAAVSRIMYDIKELPDMVQIGRVCVKKKFRTGGLGRKLMNKTLDQIAEMQKAYPRTRAMLHGQAHLKEFYESFGFEFEGLDFLEDGIPHLELIKKL